MDFVAIDFETANSSRSSVCSVGLVKVEGGKISGEFHSLVKPPKGLDEFAERNISVHGITAADVSDAPEFDQIWSEIEIFCSDLPFVAHNAAFDMSVLSRVLEIYGLRPRTRNYFCTYNLSQKTLNLMQYTLPDVAEHLGLGEFEHHEALDDARTAAQIAIKLLEASEQNSLESLASAFGVIPGVISVNGASGFHKMRRGASSDMTNANVDEFKATIDFDSINTANPCFGKKFAFTGELISYSRQEAQKEVIRRGGLKASSVGKSTDYLVVGSQDIRQLKAGADHSTKYQDAMEIRSNGGKVQVIDEELFLGMLE